MKNEPRVWVCLYDIHYPQYDQKTFRVILSFIRQNCVDGLLLGGDALDLSCVSHWNRDLPGNKLKGELSLTWTDSINISSNHSKPLLPRTCEKVFLTGNHEGMLDHDLSESMSELDGMIDFKQYLRLTERGFNVIPLGGDDQIGGLLCIHGEALGSGGGNAAKKAVEIYCQNILMGHGHQLQASSKCSPSSSKKKVCAWMSPIVGSVSPRYLKHRANAWVNGMTVVYVRDNGTFNCFPAVITDGVFRLWPEDVQLQGPLSTLLPRHTRASRGIPLTHQGPNVQLGILTRDLDKLADKDLFAIARDRRAANRAEAIRLLVQRCSAFIRRPEISDEVEALLATPPLGATD